MGQQHADTRVCCGRHAQGPPHLPACAGLWCFCGGSLELGETLLQAAVREALEETGLLMRCDPNPQGAIFSDALAWPTPLAAADSIVHDAQGAIKFHYAIVNFAATPVDPHAEPVPADDADKAQWFPVSSLRGMPGEF